MVGEEGEPLLNFVVINPTEKEDSDGSSEGFADGVALSAEMRFATRLLDLQWHQLFGGSWGNRD